MVYAQTDPPAVEPELPQVEYVWDLECRLLAAEVDLIFADALTPLHTESAPTVTTDVPGENMRAPTHAAVPTARPRFSNPEVAATQRSPPRRDEGERRSNGRQVMLHDRKLREGAAPSPARLFRVLCAGTR
ncbi:hypothetical protein SAMN04490239_1205 [Rhodococcus koreensis]|uniref:Uncharacterized protein n=1 Tax=Rhodococcus koreensis TaxID=99653 RepID=A0A1H4LDB5_9NOCA|nr:hypothetical protein SAMN04490239_1205 [Rhodococcus koreensis]